MATGAIKLIEYTTMSMNKYSIMAYNTFVNTYHVEVYIQNVVSRTVAVKAIPTIYRRNLTSVYGPLKCLGVR